MPKITIELTEDSKVTITYDHNNIVYPICDIDNNNFHISEVTNISVLTLTANVIYKCGTSLKYQLIEQGFVNKTLNKSTDGK